MTNSYGSENTEIQSLMDFENIYMEQLNFESENLNGKYYKIDIEEYKDGKQIQISLLFDGIESEYFKINSNRNP